MKNVDSRSIIGHACQHFAMTFCRPSDQRPVLKKYTSGAPWKINAKGIFCVTKLKWFTIDLLQWFYFFAITTDCRLQSRQAMPTAMLCMLKETSYRSILNNNEVLCGNLAGCLASVSRWPIRRLQRTLSVRLSVAGWRPGPPNTRHAKNWTSQWRSCCPSSRSAINNHNTPNLCNVWGTGCIRRSAKQ